MRLLAVPAGLALLAAVGLGFGVLPTRTYLDQRSEIASAEQHLEELEEANEAAAQRIEALHSDKEIERMARRDFGLARPGEEIYRVLPPPGGRLPVPDVWPFRELSIRLAPG